MGSEFTFYDYIDADGDGTNVIKSWLSGDGKDAKAYFTMIVGHLEASPPPRFTDSVWKKPYVEPMKREWSTFIALRKTGRVQYRLLDKMIGRSVYLVACGIHKGKNYETDVTPQTALIRISQMINNPAKYRREHEYN
jgi:hypothetical protein